MRKLLRAALPWIPFLIGLPILMSIPFLAIDQPTQAAPLNQPIQKERLSITTIGATGAASGTATSRVIAGQILRVDVDYGAVTNTTDLVLAGRNDLIMTRVISLTNTPTDTQLFPAAGLTDNVGLPLTYDGTYTQAISYPVADSLVLTITESTALTPAVIVDIYWQE